MLRNYSVKPVPMQLTAAGPTLILLTTAVQHPVWTKGFYKILIALKFCCRVFALVILNFFWLLLYSTCISDCLNCTMSSNLFTSTIELCTVVGFKIFLTENHINVRNNKGPYIHAYAHMYVHRLFL